MTPEERKARFKEWALERGSAKDGPLELSTIEGDGYLTYPERRVAEQYPDVLPPELEGVGNLFDVDDPAYIGSIIERLDAKGIGGGDMVRALKSYQRFLGNSSEIDPGSADRVADDDGAFVDEMVAIVERYRNVVFHGAPGTGKTHLAKRIAAKLITGDPDARLECDELSSRWGFVQFHPSYDYTDFVEGLRPISTEGGSVGFELRPGTFTVFIDRARDANSGAVSAQAVFEKSWDRLYDDITERDDVVLKTARGKEHALAPTRTGLRIEGLKDVYLQRNRVFKWWSGNGEDWYKGYFLAVVNLLKNKYGLPEFDEETFGSERRGRDDRYVFIIDEINRGDISKVFGELFFSIDPGYRGENGAVTTQYANLHDISGYAFKEKFFIPDNVYIIATMNDIDRSVDSFDYAMRRRFRFVEVRAQDTQSMLAGRSMPNAAKALEAMAELNKLIGEEDGLGARYELGASYFLSYAKGEEGAGSLWRFSLEPLLREYFHDVGVNEDRIWEYKKSFDLAVSDSGTGLGEGPGEDAIEA